jgi:hypothetical protein
LLLAFDGHLYSSYGKKKMQFSTGRRRRRLIDSGSECMYGVFDAECGAALSLLGGMLCTQQQME